MTPDDRFVLALGSFDDKARAADIAAGRQPNVEFRELVSSGRAVLFDFAAAARSRFASICGRVLGGNWMSAIASLSAHDASTSIITTGEDVGLRMALLNGLRRRSSRPALAVICHGAYLRSPKSRWAMRLLRRRDDVRFLCLSSAIAKQFVERLGAVPDRVSVIGYGVDTSFFRPAGDDVPVGERLIVSAGTASRDYRTLIAATRGLDVDVKIAADSEWFPTALDIEGDSLPVGVEARSYGDYVSLRRLYAESSVVVVPLYESLNAAGYAVIIEAMAMGKPVITTATSGRSDLIVDGETGFYVPVGDAARLRAMIEHVLDHPDVARRVGCNARRAVVETASLPVYAARIIAAARG